MTPSSPPPPRPNPPPTAPPPAFPPAPHANDFRDHGDFRDLLAEVRRRYRTRSDPITLGPLRLEFIRCADPDRVLDEVAEEADRSERRSGVRDLPGDSMHLPYWAELWDSSYVIGGMLARRDLHGVRVLDLGCGMGMTAAAAAFAGGNVVAADLEPPALDFTRLNTWPWRERVRCRLTNWQTDDLGESFPLIVGADILYERAQWPHLHRFFRQHLARGGEILLGEPGRQTGEAFVPYAKEKGWTVEVSFHDTPTRRVPVRVIVLRWAPAAGGREVGACPVNAGGRTGETR